VGAGTAARFADAGRQHHDHQSGRARAARDPARRRADYAQFSPLGFGRGVRGDLDRDIGGPENRECV